MLGEWADGRRNGYGVYKYVHDETEYHGHWVAGKMHGAGEVLDRNGRLLARGQWAEGVLVKPETIEEGDAAVTTEDVKLF
mmetsp:Transcript_29392/g.49610  ORF Transcript_29392/g.49610 Transcript_29392/m.49610 type:complete len:80 (-) Transcript_29392:81-320(-)